MTTKRRRIQNQAYRLWSRVATKDVDDCWEWIGGRISTGYGISDGKLVHRTVYEQHFGPIPAGHYVCHRCDNPPCVNPRHLFAGSAHDNHLDMVAKGRSTRGERNARSRLTLDQVRAIRQSDEHPAKLGQRYGVHRTTVLDIRAGRRWAWAK